MLKNIIGSWWAHHWGKFAKIIAAKESCVQTVKDVNIFKKKSGTYFPFFVGCGVQITWCFFFLTPFTPTSVLFVLHAPSLFQLEKNHDETQTFGFKWPWEDRRNNANIAKYIDQRVCQIWEVTGGKERRLYFSSHFSSRRRRTSFLSLESGVLP